MKKGVCILAGLLLLLTSCNPAPFSSSTPPPFSPSTPSPLYSSETSSSPDTQTIRDTEHLHLIFSDTVPTEDQIAIAGFYEGVVQAVTSRFHYALTQTITGYVGGVDYAFGENNMFYQPYLPADRFMSHELLHPLLSNVLGPSPVTLFHCRHNATNYYLFLNESAIMAFDLYFIQPPRPIHLYAAPWVRQGVTLEQILRHRETLWPSQVNHPLFSFLLYLLETYPWEDFQHLWGYHEDLKKGDWENTKAAIRTAYGKDLEEIEVGWRTMLSRIDLAPEWLATIQYTNDYLHTILAISEDLDLFGKGLTYTQTMEQWRQQTPEATKVGFGQYYLSLPLSDLQQHEQSLASMKRYFSDLIPTLAPKLALPAPKLIEIETYSP
ncbi:MAG: hypothetical protein NTV14_03855 [Coprothermobacterota bacterium]|nr:hypothetical protein [Coprothermobacterota bacterium]